MCVQWQNDRIHRPVPVPVSSPLEVDGECACMDLNRVPVAGITPASPAGHRPHGPRDEGTV
ncbi:MAG: hypothetical protein ACP5C4_02875 [Methanomicrobiales archaeon]